MGGSGLLKALKGYSVQTSVTQNQTGMAGLDMGAEIYGGALSKECLQLTREYVRAYVVGGDDGAARALPSASGLADSVMATLVKYRSIGLQVYCVFDG